MVARFVAWVTVLAVCACGMSGEGGDPADPLQEIVDGDCPDIFRQEVFPDYRLRIAAEHWAALEDEFLNRAEREEMGLDPNPYHPIELEYDGERVTDALIKLKGQSSWWQAIAFDENPKMQFIIAFNEVDPDGRFHGVRKVSLDMPRTDASFLRQRVSLYFLRRAGVPAQCGNSARLTINGEYYGLYTNLEKLDKEFLQRVYGDDDAGDLWEGGRIIQTNEDTFSWTRLSALWDAVSLSELEALSDLDASVRVWAAEAMAPHGDGYYNGRANYYLYDHPRAGFSWLPHDLDSGFDFIPADTSPLFPWCADRNHNDRQHWALVMADAGWQQYYVDELAAAREAYDVDVLEALLDDWAAQIEEAALGDPMKPFSGAEHRLAIESLRNFPRDRAATVDDFLTCRYDGGVDGDGDGFERCHDCDDTNSAAHPGAEEVCNGADDDCDGQIDEDELGEELC